MSSTPEGRILMVTAILLSLLFCAPLAGQSPPDFPINLRQGIMAGEVGETSAILQSRLTSSNPRQDPRWEGIRGARGWARFEVAANDQFRGSRMTDWVEASPYSDFLVKAKVTGLAPATRHHCRLHYGPKKDDLRISDAGQSSTIWSRSVMWPESGRTPSSARRLAMLGARRSALRLRPRGAGGNQRLPQDGQRRSEHYTVRCRAPCQGRCEDF